MLAVADESTDRLVRLVNNVLDLQRIESGEVTMQVSICSAAELVEQATEAVQTMATQQGITLVPRLTPISIWADPDYIVQTLTNLIGNAIKFSNPGKTITIETRLHRSTAETIPPPRVSSAAQVNPPPERPTSSPLAMALFAVRDQGQGIPAHKLTSIFERFQQVDSSDSRKKGGTGLGLTICRKIVEQHGGSIWAESVVGQGSCFYFTIPVAPDYPISTP